jgi:hypothetical protein
MRASFCSGTWRASFRSTLLGTKTRYILPSTCRRKYGSVLPGPRSPFECLRVSGFGCCTRRAEPLMLRFSKHERDTWQNLRHGGLSFGQFEIVAAGEGLVGFADDLQGLGCEGLIIKRDDARTWRSWFGCRAARLGRDTHDSLHRRGSPRRLGALRSRHRRGDRRPDRSSPPTKPQQRRHAVFRSQRFDIRMWSPLDSRACLRKHARHADEPLRGHPRFAPGRTV